MTPPLENLERWFQAVVTHPGGAAEGAACEAARATIDCERAEDVVTASSRQSAVERLDVYARAYWSRLIECLQEEFPVLRSAVGDEAFDRFAAGYLFEHPSQSYTLNRLGEQFPAYLAGTCPPDDGWSAPIVELARLERAINEVFDLPGGETLGYLSPRDLEQVPAERRGEIRLRPLPTLRLLKFNHAINDYFTALRVSAEEALPPLERVETFLALSRRGYIVRRTPLSHAQYAVLDSLASGDALETAIAKLTTCGEAVTPEELRRWFAIWSEAGLFQGLSPMRAT